MSSKEPIAVFGFTDPIAGQVEKWVNEFTDYEIAFFASTSPLPDLDIEAEHAKRPNRKTEFIEDGRIYGKPIYDDVNPVALLKEKGITKAFLLEDHMVARQATFNALKDNGIEVLSFVHPSVTLAGGNHIGEGTVIFPNCFIGYKSDVEDGVIMQANCAIEHHNVIGAFNNINPGLRTGGFTKTEERVEINICVDIINRITIGHDARVGAGSLVLKNLAPEGLYHGRPATFARKNTLSD